MSVKDLIEQHIARLEAEQDRLVADCLATADWLEKLIGSQEFLLTEAEFVSEKTTELRRLFLPPVRYDDTDCVQERYGKEDF